MRFEQLDVVDGERCRSRVHTEYVVAAVAQVADGDLEPARVGARRPEQDGLFRAATGAPNASQLENADRSHAAVTVSRASREGPPRCGARDTSASARPASRKDATTKD